MKNEVLGNLEDMGHVYIEDDFDLKLSCEGEGREALSITQTEGFSQEQPNGDHSPISEQPSANPGPMS